MNIPTIGQAEELLSDAESLYPGLWVAHNRIAGICARTIAQHCAGMDADKAYVLGLLHDIGRRFGLSDMKHIIDGYHFMKDQGFDLSARICLTHSFPYKDIRAYNGKNDCSPEDSVFIQSFLEQTDYTDDDRLIQLCDALAYPTGATYIEKRLVDVVLRRGFNDLTVLKWREFLNLKTYFDGKAGMDVYQLLAEN